MTNVLILSQNLKRIHYLSSCLMQIIPTITIIVAKTKEEAIKLAHGLWIRIMIVDLPFQVNQELSFIKSIRQRFENHLMPIILITQDSRIIYSNVLNLYGLISFPYPFDLQPFKKYVKLVFNELFSNSLQHNSLLKLDMGQCTKVIIEDDILYIEYISRRIVIFTRKEVIEYKYMPLKKFNFQLSAQFVQVHQSIIVNINAVVSYNHQLSELKLVDLKHPLSVGRSYQKSIRELIKRRFESISELSLTEP